MSTGGAPKRIEDAESSEKITAPAELDVAQEKTLEWLRNAEREDDEPYAGEVAAMDDSEVVADTAEMEAACEKIEAMNRNEGVQTRIKVSQLPFNGVLLQDSKMGPLKYCGECGDHKTCFVSVRMQTTVRYGDLEKEKLDSLVSLVDGPICSTLCLSRKVLAVRIDQVRLLNLRAEESRGKVKDAIDRKIAYVQLQNVLLGRELEKKPARFIQNPKRRLRRIQELRKH